MNKVVEELERSLIAGKEVPDLRPGYKVKVHTKVKEAIKKEFRFLKA